ncbi:MAG TPA: Wzz/FepE/Etk N-terminal domain-containing protein [Acidobacteriaceae bacterium]|nr:Wzz/FepE/Etk N-terminal domain-containing protein [Acidobacteriaceae bacterium]
MMTAGTNTEHLAVEQVGLAPTSRGDAPTHDDSVDMLDLALILAARKWFIFLCSFLAALVTAIVVLIMPVTYTATTSMLPPQQEESSASMMLEKLGGLASMVGGGGGGVASMMGLKKPDDLYIGLLQSDTVMDGIVHRFDLMHVYKAKKFSDARKMLDSKTKIISQKSSLISISVKDHDAKRAAAIANAYVAGLHELMSHLAVTSAAQRRVFFEQQVEQAKAKLSDAEVALERTELKTGIIQPQGQAQAVIVTIMQLRAQIAASEVELGALRTSATDQNPEVITLQSQIAALREQLADFEKGHPGSAVIAGNVLTPTSQVPAASLEYLRGMRDVRYQEMLFDFMAQQYEMAKVDEAKQSQMIQVVDPALVPDRRSWPLRTLLTLLAFFLGAVFSMCWTISQSAYERAKEDPETAMKLHQLRQQLRVRSDRT